MGLSSSKPKQRQRPSHAEEIAHINAGILKMKRENLASAQHDLQQCKQRRMQLLRMKQRLRQQLEPHKKSCTCGSSLEAIAQVGHMHSFHMNAPGVRGGSLAEVSRQLDDVRAQLAKCQAANKRDAALLSAVKNTLNTNLCDKCNKGRQQNKL